MLPNTMDCTFTAVPAALRDVVHAAVKLGAIVHPAGEHRAHGAPQLGLRLLREVTAQLTGDHRLVFGDHSLPVVGGKRGVDGHLQPVLGVVQHALERRVLQAEHHVGVHLDEAAVAVEGEAAVARQARQALDRLVVQAEVQHRVHHPGHRRAGARAHRDQQRVGRVAEPLAGQRLHLRQAGGDLRLQPRRVGLAVQIVVDAGLGGDGEAGGHRQAQARHLGQVRALAAQEVLHGGRALRPSSAEGVDPLGGPGIGRPISHQPSPEQSIALGYSF